MAQTSKVCIYLYNRLFDPLIQGNFWLYIKDYLEDTGSGVKFHVVSYEDDRHPLTEEQLLLVDEWRAKGLDWTPLKWHSGMGLTRKAWDLVTGFLTLFRLRTKGYRHVVTLGSVAGCFAYLCARVLGMRLFLYQFEPHSEYSRDAGMWPEESLQYRISHALERRAAAFASVIASGTRFMEERLKKEWKVDAAFVKIATVANDAKFSFDPVVREQVRSELGFAEDNPVLFYPGKFHGIYYGVETAWMFRWLSDLEPRLRMLVVTPNDIDSVTELFGQAGVDPAKYVIRQSGYDQIEKYYFAGDMGVIAVPPGPSRKFVSNIKVGEYLCAGMPYLTPAGVSEDYLYATENDVGVVVGDFSRGEIESAWPRIKRYFDLDPESRRSHCRTKGLEYRGFDTLNPKFKSAIQKLIER